LVCRIQGFAKMINVLTRMFLFLPSLSRSFNEPIVIPMYRGWKAPIVQNVLIVPFSFSSRSLPRFSPSQRERTYMSLDDNIETDRHESQVKEIEIEQKFSLLTQSGVRSVEEKLTSLGFVPLGKEKKFTDTYFDTPSPKWVLSMQDCWLRLREAFVDERTRGIWELKVGRKVSGESTTVYEEIAGPNAVATAIEILRRESGLETLSRAEIVENDGLDSALSFLIECGLVPFAKFETTRSRWSALQDKENSLLHGGLTVDLDATDFGYMVGEVEAIVSHENDVTAAKEKIGRLVENIVGKIDNGEPALGKLEMYLIERSPDHYKACIKAGAMKAKG